MDTLILTGWGWKEYAVAAAAALRALDGKADTARADCGNRPGTGNPPGGRCGSWKKWGRV